jgi:DNA processing protein
MQHSEDNIFYEIALSFVPLIGPKLASSLISEFGSAKDVLFASQKKLMSIEGMGEQRANSLKDHSIFKDVEKEMEFILSKKIKVLTQQNEDYPKRLLQCSDAPQILYFKGTANLNALKTVAIIGTRKNTEYGQRLTNDLIEGLAKISDIIVVSGLAHGIDTIAHKASLKNNIPTIGVLGHGLNMLYPIANKNLAKEMLDMGGLLTEFASISKMDKGNFPARNRIVAGLSDVVVVVESDIKGGALITANIANSYNREVMAYPGRAYDHKSFGTNLLIQKNMAALITNSDDLLDFMGWQKQKRETIVQAQLMLHLSEEEQSLIKILEKKDLTHSDELLQLSGMSSSLLASNLLILEMQGLIKSLPGKFYRLN